MDILPVLDRDALICHTGLVLALKLTLLSGSGISHDVTDPQHSNFLRVIIKFSVSSISWTQKAAD